MSPADAYPARSDHPGLGGPEKGTQRALSEGYDLPAGRKRNLRRLYGLTQEDFVLLLVAQDDRCPMCLKPFRQWPVSWSPHVEHDHRTGELYGLTDMNCNDLLGRYGRDPAFYERVAEFLRNPPAREALGRRHYVPGAPPRTEEEA